MLEKKASKKQEFDLNDRVKKIIEYLFKLSKSKRDMFVKLLREVQRIQKSNISDEQKKEEIKKILWSNHSPSIKLSIGAALGTLLGLMVFGTGGLGIAAFGSGIGVWGFLAGTTGGILISSIIQNFEKRK